MSSELSEISRKLNKYYNLKDTLNRIIISLGNSADSLQRAALKISEFYSIDDSSADDRRIDGDRNEVVHMRDTLKNGIVPAINEAIDSLLRERRRIEAEIAAKLLEAKLNE